jgi:DNA polymerase III sliding clamp (beta) subunit (PCNA family)
MIKTLTKHAKRKQFTPILNQVRVVDGMAQTTDMDLWITAPVALTDGMYHAEGFDEGIQIKSGLKVADFPEPNKNNKEYEKASTTIDLAAADALGWVMKAASNEEIRYYLCGAFFDWTEEQAVIVATDGHRLHSFTHSIDAARPKKTRKKQADGKYKMVSAVAGAIMPTRAVKIILDLMKETGADNAELEFEGLLFTARVGAVLVQGKLIDGTYPEWRQAVPTYPPRNKTFYDPRQIKALLPELTIRNQITLGYDEEPVLAINKGTACTVFGDKREWPCTIQWDMEVVFNAKYLADLCGGVMEYIDKSSPFKVTDRRGGIERMAAIMPMGVY